MSDAKVYEPAQPLGGARGFRPPSIPGRNLEVTAPHKALKSIACGKLTFDERVVRHRVVGGSIVDRKPAWKHWWPCWWTTPSVPFREAGEASS